MNIFFGIVVDPNSTAWMAAALAFAVLLGGLIGLERQLHGHPAGLRTHILVTMGSALFTLIGVQMARTYSPGGDATRIAAQIVTGIGFLGAGSILRDGGSIKGLTTAASIWACAGIGMAVGAAPKLGELGTMATAIVLLTLWGLHHVEIWMKCRQDKASAGEGEVRSGGRS